MERAVASFVYSYIAFWVTNLAYKIFLCPVDCPSCDLSCGKAADRNLNLISHIYIYIHTSTSMERVYGQDFQTFSKVKVLPPFSLKLFDMTMF